MDTLKSMTNLAEAAFWGTVFLAMLVALIAAVLVVFCPGCIAPLLKVLAI